MDEPSPIVLRASGYAEGVYAWAGDPVYLPEVSDPEVGLFVWSYTVRFANLGKTPVQLVGRKWLIRNLAGEAENVLAATVGGAQPTLVPGAEPYVYESGVPLVCPSNRPAAPASMAGAFGFLSSEGRRIVVETEPFALIPPPTTGIDPASKITLKDDDPAVMAFRVLLDRYMASVIAERPDELRLSQLGEIDCTKIRNYLLIHFPFNNRKEPTEIEFSSINHNLIGIPARDIFLLSKSGQIDIIIKWWPNERNISFLDKHEITDEMRDPDLGIVRLLAAYRYLEQLDLDDPNLSEEKRRSNASKLVTTYARLKRMNPDGVDLPNTPKLQHARRMIRPPYKPKPRHGGSAPKPE